MQKRDGDCKINLIDMFWGGLILVAFVTLCLVLLNPSPVFGRRDSAEPVPVACNSIKMGTDEYRRCIAPQPWGSQILGRINAS